MLLRGEVLVPDTELKVLVPEKESLALGQIVTVEKCADMLKNDGELSVGTGSRRLVSEKNNVKCSGNNIDNVNYNDEKEKDLIAKQGNMKIESTDNIVNYTAFTPASASLNPSLIVSTNTSTYMDSNPYNHLKLIESVGAQQERVRTWLDKEKMGARTGGTYSTEIVSLTVSIDLYDILILAYINLNLCFLTKI